MCVQSLGREDPLKREWQVTPVFLPRESHGQRSLAGYNPWGRKELDMTEQLTHISTHTYICVYMYTHTHIYIYFLFF